MNPMRIKAFPLFILLQSSVAYVQANEIDQRSVEKLQNTVKDEIVKCSKQVNNSRVSDKSALTKFFGLFAKNYPKECIQLGLDRYRKSVYQIANTPLSVEDRLFRDNLESLLSEVEIFSSNLSQREAYTDISLSQYSTASGNETLRATTSTETTVRGFTTVTHEK